jgi:hypothetical protein
VNAYSTKIVGEPATGNQCNRFDEGGGLISASTLMGSVVVYFI